MKITTEFVVKVKIEEEISKKGYEQAIKQKSLKERKAELENDIVAELKDTFDTEDIKIHEFKVKVEEDE